MSALVLLSAGPAHALTAKQKRRLCYPRGSITKLVTRQARVYQANPAKRTEQINVMDLRSGRTRSVTTRASIIGLTPRGTLVWIGPDPAGQALMAIDAQGQRVLDSGDIDPGFLKVFGTLVLWSKAREGRWVDLA